MVNTFFVYGTLKIGGYFAKQFDKKRKSSQNAKIDNYDMFRISNNSIGGFPGIVPGTNTVYGEVHTFSEKNILDVITMMDMIEGYEKNHKKTSLYLRKKLPIKLKNGYTELTNIYIYNGNVSTFEHIKSGIWEIAKNA